ncbi:hypothetical protein FRC10_004690 [Ceratobasidium sp. 414]|nr:hypothetical protein FRC10_004690 [Ceratobasidium sp. 414]
MAASGVCVPLSNGFASLSLAGPPSTPTSRGKLKDKLSWNFDEFARKIKPKFPDFVVFAATMTGLPIVRDAMNSVQAMQDWTSCRQKLVDFRQKLERLLNAIKSHSQDPGYMNATRTEFKRTLEDLLAQVRRESARQSSSHFGSTTRLLALMAEYEERAIILAEEVLVSGVFVQQNIELPEEYDKIIPTVRRRLCHVLTSAETDVPQLKSLHRGNGLVQETHVKTERYDGGPVEQAPVENLHVTTHQGTYKDVPVEIKEYFGGSEDKLLQNLKELVGHYQMFDNNGNLPRLFGGSIDRLPDGKLCAYLVFSPVEGDPWIDVARAKQSVELLCQVVSSPGKAEQTIQAFEYLKIRKQMNVSLGLGSDWESIRIRPDGTLLIVPSTQGDNFLLSEDVWDPMGLPEDAPWPIKELCELLQEADRQGIPWDAIAALRAHAGPWDRIAVWKVAKQIGLRPSEVDNDWYDYPPPDWQVHGGTIVDLAYDKKSFEQLDKMPRQGLGLYERKHLRRFNITSAMGNTIDGEMVNYRRRDGPCYLQQMPDPEWECHPLEPWENIKTISLMYESERFTMAPWDQWKIILASCAKRRGRDVNKLAIVTRIEVILTLYKCNVPELGTRPVYFFRKPNQATATPREFWGFFSFNPDPNGPTGISVRVNPLGLGRLVSDSVVEPDPESWTSNSIELDFAVVWVSMQDDWENKIQEQLDRTRRNPSPIFMEEDITWSGDEGEIITRCDWNF